jgi:hypothetical protein
MDFQLATGKPGAQVEFELPAIPYSRAWTNS